MHKYTILWADDEIHLLKPHILFLEQRGYKVTPVNNGSEAVEFCQSKHYDIVFLDENMPGISGLEALNKIKALKPTLPVVMITKDEEEQVMEEAIGAQVDDYLIKPLNRSQVLSAVKKITDNKRLIAERANVNYQQGFHEISAALQQPLDYTQWVEIYKKIIFWELQLDSLDNREMAEILNTQKTEANIHFSRFVKRHYESWLNGSAYPTPLLSHQVMKEKVLPQLKDGVPCFLLVIDNLRLDQWKIIKPIIEEFYSIAQEETYYSILPTATAYSRNAIFSGMLPLDMATSYPDWWVDDGEAGRNNFEKEFIADFLKRHKCPIKFSYTKIKKAEEGRSLAASINNLFGNDLNVVVYNFVDMLSHARTDMAVIQELAPDEAAYRSLTKSWFSHSPLLDILKKISEKKVKLIITTDHGTIRVKHACKIMGDRTANTNLRYKEGKNLNCNSDKVMRYNNPKKIFLPQKSSLASTIFAVEDQFFIYPTHYNHYVNLYANTFQHGGISLEEMIIPLVSLTSKAV